MAEKIEYETEKRELAPDEVPDMHELLATASPAQRAMAEMERLMREQSEDAPPKIKEDHLPPGTKLYTDELGRNHAIDDIQAQGTFFIKPTRRHVTRVTVGLTLPSVAITVLVIALLDLLLIGAPDRALSIIIFILIIEVLVILSVAWLVLYNCITKTRGKLYRYKADGRGFYVTIKEQDKITGLSEVVKNIEQIFYKDVVSVAYTPTTLLRGNYGYEVDIILTYGTVHFDYIFPHFNRVIPLKELPFDIIKRNIPKRDDDTEQ